ncbi:hypothetical protein BDZ89DRAFT_369512 [Hymenopellis radicata]|nr:hypothetical protein BDZ89DRAFT_369512 [Hymenopellis radicata]
MEPSTSRSTRDFITLALRSQELCRWRRSSVADILDSCMPHGAPDTVPSVASQADFQSENADCILQQCVDFIQRAVGSEQRQHLPLTPTVIHEDGFRTSIVGLKSPLATALNAFTFLEGFVFVVQNDSDPFVDYPSNTDHTTRRISLDSSPKSLMLVGELLAYAGRVFATQYRHHLFTLILFARTARLIRWDRTQALVSASFDHRENSDILASILQRFTRMSPFQRGTDPFVTEGEVSFEEVEMLREALKQAPPEVREHSGDECLGLMVLPGNEDLPLLLLASKPDASTTQAPFCHRGSISPPRYAYNTRTRSFVLLLDAFVRKGAAHSDVYTALHRHDVPNVPTLLWQGVVRPIVATTVYPFIAVLSSPSRVSDWSRVETRGDWLDILQTSVKPSKMLGSTVSSMGVSAHEYTFTQWSRLFNKLATGTA